MKYAITFKYCKKGCGKDYYYGYSVEQTVGTVEQDKQLSKIPIILFDNLDELDRKSNLFDKIIVVYLFRSVYRGEAFQEAVKLKKYSKFITIASGAHPSGDPIGTLKYFDYVIVGDCEIVIRDLIKNIIDGNKRPKIKGVWYKVYNELINGGKAEFVDLNEIPPFAPKHNLFAPIEITRGCQYACKFCCVTYIYGGKLRHRKIGEIIKWVKIMKKYGRKVVNFLTPNAFSYGSSSGERIAKDKIEKLLRNLAKIKGVKIIFGNYLSNVRPDFVSEDLIKLVKKYTQTPTIHMGGQSGSDRILKAMNVGYTVNDIKRAVKIVRRFGLKCSVDIIFGLPGEEGPDRRKTFELIDFLIAQDAKPRIHTFMPLPGTPFAKYPAGKIPLEYKKLFRKLAQEKKVMLPFEYEEAAYK